ncbi:FHA domain-containing protein [Fibrella arboris]|uniref:FHA domain-containing protein n=1 Tax=Fibrella arboris TaxID=3242486 RepID=UPI003520CEC7
MAIYKFSCPDCLKQFDTESDFAWKADQKASVNCLVGKQPKCTVVCLGVAEPRPQPAAGETAATGTLPPSTTPTILLDDPMPSAKRTAYLEVQSMDGGILRLMIGEGRVQTFGRKSEFDLSDHPIQTDDKKMSRLHFQIDSRMHNKQPSYIVSDLSSVHGTRITRQTVNGITSVQLYADKDDKPSRDCICLEHDDLIMAGSTILRFAIDSVSSADFSMNDLPDQTNYDPNRTTVF